VKRIAQKNFKKPAFGSAGKSFRKPSSFGKSTGNRSSSSRSTESRPFARSNNGEETSSYGGWERSDRPQKSFRKSPSFGSRSSEFSERGSRDFENRSGAPRNFDRDRSSFGQDRPSFNRERSSFGQDRPSYGRDRSSFSKNYNETTDFQDRRSARSSSSDRYEDSRFSEEESAWLGETRDYESAPRKNQREKPSSTFVRSGAPRTNKDRTGFAPRRGAPKKYDVATSFKEIEVPATVEKSGSKKKTAEKTGELLFGAHSIIEALKAKRRKLISVYTTQPTPRAWERVQPYLPKSVPNIQYVNTNILSSMAEGGKHMGIVAWFAPFPYRSKMFDPSTHPLIVILDGVQDVQNLGAILRSAHCVGFNGVVLNTSHAAPLTGGAHKASAGLAEHMDIHLATSSRNAVIEAKKAGYNLYLAVVNGGENAINVEYTGPACLIIGSEEMGIAADLRNEGTKISLPQKTEDISFNASVAAGILMFVMQQKLK